MNREQAKDFLGKGWKFPIEVDKTTGRIKMATEEDDIAEAIKIIIRTAKGERVMRKSFGCSLNKYMFGENDFSTLSQMEIEIKDALISFEPRITDVDVEVSSGENGGILMINISYRVRETNNMFNMVYPYYLNEGTI